MKRASPRPSNCPFPWQRSFPFNHPLLFVIPSAPACRRSKRLACGKLREEGTGRRRSPSTHECPIPWQQPFPFNHPLLFVIPPAPACRGSEARNLRCASISPRFPRASELRQSAFYDAETFPRSASRNLLCGEVASVISFSE